MNDGCTTNAGTITVESESGNPVDVVLSSPSDVILVNNHAGVTLKNLTVQASSTTNRAILATGTSFLGLEGSLITGGIDLDGTGTNTGAVSGSVISGNLEVKTNASVTFSEYSVINGQAVSNRSLILSSSSTLTQTANSVLELAGANWTNNGGALSLHSSSSMVLSGSVNQTIGGSSPNAFRRLLVSNTGAIAFTSPATMKKWLQTSNSTITAGTNTIRIQDSILTGPGKFVHTGAGKIDLLANSIPAVVQGQFWNLDANNSANYSAAGNIVVDNALNLNAGRMDLNGSLLTVDNTVPSSLSTTTGSWINGTVRRRVATGSYSYPLGTSSVEQRVVMVVYSLSGGLQYVDASFVAQDPMSHPVSSTFVPNSDFVSIYSNLIPNGYWRLSPDVGTASFDLRLFPTFFTPNSPFTLYRRPISGSGWSLGGALSNPEATLDHVQSDGSIRRTGFNSFGDFAMAETDEDPLSVAFTEFRLSKARKGVLLQWKLSDCYSDPVFSIFRGQAYGPFERRSLEIRMNADCRTYFAFDPQTPHANLAYQVQFTDSDNEVAHSPVRWILPMGQMESFSLVQAAENRFYAKDLFEEQVDVRISDLNGKEVYSSTLSDGKWLELGNLPPGMYVARIMGNSQVRFQKIRIGWE